MNEEGIFGLDGLISLFWFLIVVQKVLLGVNRYYHNSSECTAPLEYDADGNILIREYNEVVIHLLKPQIRGLLLKTHHKGIL